MIAVTLLMLISPVTVQAAEVPARPERDVFAKLPPIQAKPMPRVFRVVVDAGHGGTDTGTYYVDHGRKIAEKDVTLMLARRVANELRTRGMTVFLTREDDRELALGARTALANRLKANVFLSIHMNSSAGRMQAGAEGIETYILNNTSDASSKRLAQLENTVLGSTYDTSTPEATDVSLILKDLRLDANQSESKKLACAVQQGLLAATTSAQAQIPALKLKAKKAKNRGIKQALFHVLLGADMPSVLVEAGFLSSVRDRAAVLSYSGQKLMARAIAGAVENFRRSKDQADIALALNRCKVIKGAD
jgi:N-acetylmuramoyl-L-alanine amidase